MGYVTKTEAIGETMVSHTFEDYADFVKWSMNQDDTVPTPFSEGAPSKEGVSSKEEYTLTLTEDEAYTLQVLLGYVVDGECNRISEKLEKLTGEDMQCEDYDKLYFKVSRPASIEMLSSSSDLDIDIRFK